MSKHLSHHVFFAQSQQVILKMTLLSFLPDCDAVPFTIQISYFYFKRNFKTVNHATYKRKPFLGDFYHYIMRQNWAMYTLKNTYSVPLERIWNPFEPFRNIWDPYSRHVFQVNSKQGSSFSIKCNFLCTKESQSGGKKCPDFYHSL